MQLRPRFKTILENLKEFNPSTTLWDIGCDHGLIGYHALNRHLIQKAYFVEKSNTVHAKVNSLSLEKDSFEIHRCDARFTDLSLSGNVLIAGMGGLMIEKILKKQLDNIQGPCRLILNPYGNEDVVEEFLFHSYFKQHSVHKVKDRSALRRIYVFDN